MSDKAGKTFNWKEHGCPFLIAAALKSVYDLGLCALFRNPERR